MAMRRLLLTNSAFEKAISDAADAGLMPNDQRAMRATNGMAALACSHHTSSWKFPLASYAG